MTRIKLIPMHSAIKYLGRYMGFYPTSKVGIMWDTLWLRAFNTAWDIKEDL